MSEKIDNWCLLNNVVNPQLSNPNPDSYRDGLHYAICGGCQILPKKLEVKVDL